MKFWLVFLGCCMCLTGAAYAEENVSPDRVITITAFGDSLSAGYGLPAEQSFPAQLEAALKAKGHAVRVINAGVSGDTTAGGKARLEWVLQDKPEIVILELGANDALRGLPPEQVDANLDAMLTRMKAANVEVLLAGMRAPINMGLDYANRFNGIYERLAKKHGVALYPFFLEGVAGNRALNLPDGIHPTGEGIAVIVTSITPQVEKLLKQLKL